MKKCPYCGKEYPDDATICAIDEYALDGTLDVTTSFKDKSPSAGFWIRALARVIDFFFSMLVSVVTGFVTSVLLYILDIAGIIGPEWRQHVSDLTLGSFVFGFFGSISYHTFCEGIHGATLGKLCCGLCVMNEDMKPSNLKGP
jgi:uncharacterized RDD family membrane protein YckC